MALTHTLVVTAGLLALMQPLSAQHSHSKHEAVSNLQMLVPLVVPAGAEPFSDIPAEAFELDERPPPPPAAPARKKSQGVVAALRAQCRQYVRGAAAPPPRDYGTVLALCAELLEPRVDIAVREDSDLEDEPPAPPADVGALLGRLRAQFRAAMHMLQEPPAPPATPAPPAPPAPPTRLVLELLDAARADPPRDGYWIVLDRAT